jgi:hypothetical protein
MSIASNLLTIADFRVPGRSRCGSSCSWRLDGPWPLLVVRSVCERSRFRVDKPYSRHVADGLTLFLAWASCSLMFLDSRLSIWLCSSQKKAREPFYICSLMRYRIHCIVTVTHQIAKLTGNIRLGCRYCSSDVISSFRDPLWW